MTNQWLEGLNPEQQEAVLHDGGPLLILAGAGSGKTTVLVSRAGRLIDQGISKADELCVLTFTNKAARELKARVGKKLGSKAKGLWAGTFHSFGLKLLRQYHKEAKLIKDFGVLDPTDAAAIAKELLKDFKNPDKEAFDGQTLLELMTDWKETGQTQAKTEDPYEIAIEWLLPKMEKRFESLGVVDFDRLILKPIELMQEYPLIKEQINERIQYLMVDEFQDTNRAQMKLVDLLSCVRQNVAVVGDDDQSIYGWRGACVKNILDFPQRFNACRVVRLERNYRSAPQILEVANSVIRNNRDRHEKKLKATVDASLGNPPKLIVAEDENEEVEYVSSEIQEFKNSGFALKQVAVLYRSNGQGAFLEAELRKQQTPYSITGGTAFFDKKETRDVLAYLRSALRPNDISVRRILNVPSRGIGETTFEKLTEYSTTHNIRFSKALPFWKEAGVDERAGKGIQIFLQDIEKLVPLILTKAHGTFGQGLLHYLEGIGYRLHLEKTAPNATSAVFRWKLIELFGKVLDRYLDKNPTKEGLQEFLESMELRDLPDDDKGVDKVQLMTLHACKGLEWEAVIFMGVEEDLIPHRSLGGDIQEERRLFYVGVTRARKHLIFTRALNREKNGKRQPTVASRFIAEIPKELLQQQSGRRLATKEQRRAILDAFYKKLETKPDPPPHL